MEIATAEVELAIASSVDQACYCSMASSVIYMYNYIFIYIYIYKRKDFSDEKCEEVKKDLQPF